jgi:hypothetical protein
MTAGKHTGKNGPPNRLAGVRMFELMQYVQTYYAASQLHDTAFAAQASEALGFPVTAGNVQGARYAFGIEATLTAKARERAEPRSKLDRLEAALLATEAKLTALEARVSALEREL